MTIEEDTTHKTTSCSSWGTWEELLLACAVKRHGLNNWDSVAMELQIKTSLPHHLTTPQFCQHKYMDLKSRFKDNHHQQEPEPWLQHLRKLRVDELKQDLQRYDLSIHCLQLKVKRLEEERERCLDNNNTNNNNNNNPNTDPEPDLNEPRPAKLEEPDKTSARLASGDESDRDNRSVNESNSTGLSDKVGVQGGDFVRSEAGPGRSGQGGTMKVEESEELGDSVTQLSRDVQSSASYGRKKRKLGSGGDAKSEPLIGLFDLIRTHKHAFLFERLQESTKYKEMVRQHMDLHTIQTTIEQGTYSSCHLTFYRDLLLLFNNAIVFFPKSSLESFTAHQLRRLVSIHINKDTLTPKPESSQEPVSLPPQPKPKPHIIVCRKRASVSTFSQKPDLQQQQQSSDDKKPASTDIKPSSVERSSNSLLKLKTGTRSTRRNTNNNNPTATNTPSSNKKQSMSASASVDKQETSKTDNKKKTEASSSSDKKKSVVDFLKRIKKNSPVQTEKKNNSKAVSEEPQRNNNKKGKERQTSAERKRSPPKKNAGRPSRKAAETTPVTGKRSREMVVAKRQSKRARR